MRIMTLALTSILLCSSCVYFYPETRVSFAYGERKYIPDEKSLSYHWSDHEREGYLEVGIDVDKEREEGTVVLHGALVNIRIHDLGNNYFPPYGIYIGVRGLLDYHTSFTVKRIDIKTHGGEGFSNLANTELPVTVVMEENAFTVKHSVLVPVVGKSYCVGSYRISNIFYFKPEQVTVTVTLEIHRVDGSETVDVVFEFNPVERKINWHTWIG